MEELVFEMLKTKGLINDKDDLVANNEIEVNGNEVIVKGNKRGLILLADYLVQIAISDSLKKHIHLDIDNFFDKANCDLIICKE
ncbi:Imm32 family immunity protein [Acetivibrio clariflavus]|uniref:Uncharacterized protein n=1 Tax=Acetivibrio clariflavus (strain DSM 19732 / NBRC 101661 / EBR45) TaxID=720554 RepID=G8LZJ4_ACECE|nr:hypothetical protein [Acetivibrio clariflavus]AEV66857.1 hypothetical protein Clocl_0105 [Acetivibrio clariflavus DSM 19732]HOP99555.1 hypothetical protein [Acetivibrio clariflavus]